MAKRKCVICGEFFESKSSRRLMCYKEHYHSCPVCGKPVLSKDMHHLNTCCSKECSRIKANESLSDYWKSHPEAVVAKQEKVQQTNLERYGVANVMDDPEIRSKQTQKLREYTDEHGEEMHCKRQKTFLERYGGASPMQCPEIRHRIESTNLSKYGVECTLHLPEVEAKSKETVKQRYGVDNVSQSEVVHDKVKTTMLKRYGVKYTFQNPKLRGKFTSTMLKRYGVEHALHDPHIKSAAMKHHAETFSDPEKRTAIRKKANLAFESRYGGRGFASPDLSEKSKSTMLTRYGVTHYSASVEGKLRIKAIFRSKFGTDNPMQAESVKAKLRATLFKKSSPQMQKFRLNPEAFICELPEYQRTEPIIAEKLGVTPSAISLYVQKLRLHNIVNTSISYMEDSICSILDEWNIKYSRCVRSIISPLELDIYIPEHQLAIECNPTITHNSSFNTPWGGDPKSYMYHKTKSVACRKAGIFLFHIFGYEWEDRPEVIKSMLANLLHKTEHRVYARNTYIEELSSEESMAFLEANHRQGSTNASIRLGLFETSSQKLVSVMTFNKVRSTIGETANSNGIVELSRFCNAINTTVVGAASKMFSYFKSKYQFDKIISFSDVAHTKGSLYSILGFHAVNESKPSYVWVSLKGNLYFNRVNCQKKNLPNLFSDVTEADLSNHTEREIMMNHGFAQVFDSGTIRWEYNKAED